MMEICEIYYNEETVGWWSRVLEFFRGFSYRTHWFEAYVGEKLIATGEKFRVRESEIDALGLPEWQSVFAYHKERLVFELMADGWKPVRDPETGDVSSLKRTSFDISHERQTDNQESVLI